MSDTPHRSGEDSVTIFDIQDDEPCYIISVAAQLVEMHAQSLRYYERAGLIRPARSRGNIRLYSPRDIERLRLIRRLIDDLGVNLAGVEVILNMTDRIQQLEREIERLKGELAAAQSLLEQAGLHREVK